MQIFKIQCMKRKIHLMAAKSREKKCEREGEREREEAAKRDWLQAAKRIEETSAAHGKEKKIS